MCIKFRPKETEQTETGETGETGSTEGETATTEATGDVPTPPETEQEEPPLFIIESDPYSYAKECSLKTGCLCNVNASDWAAWEQINPDKVAFPDPVLVPVGPYDKLLESSELDTEETLYERQIYNELLNGTERTKNTVIHPLNFWPSNTFPAYETNPEVPGIADNCTEKIECQLYYEPTWDFYLKAAFTCDEIVSKQPCFGTFACTCDNQYKSISAKMPKLEGEVVEPAEEDDSGTEAWLVIVIICSVIVAIVGVIAVVMYIKKRKERQGTMIQPISDGKIEMKTKGGKGSIETGNLGGSAVPHIQVPNTEDMTSQMDIANPDSFIGSKQNTT